MYESCVKAISSSAIATNQRKKVDTHSMLLCMNGAHSKNEELKETIYRLKKSDVTRDTKIIGFMNGTTKTLEFDTITKNVTNVRCGREFGMFLWRKEKQSKYTYGRKVCFLWKNFNGCVARHNTRLLTVDEVSSGNKSLTPKRQTIMFVFSNTVLLVRYAYDNLGMVP